MKNRNLLYAILMLSLLSAKAKAQFISSSGAYISVSSGTVLSSDTISVNNTSTLANGGTLNIYSITNAGTTQGNGTYNISGLFTNTGTFTCGTSLVNYNGSAAQTVTALNYYNLTVSANGTRTITIPSSGTVGIANSFSPATSNTSYTVTGSTIHFNGAAQSIPYFTYHNITATGNTKTLAASFSITGDLTLGSSTVLDLSSYNIILKSSATATARLATVPGTSSLAYGTGKFIVERYIPGRRKYRLITSSVTTYAGSTLSGGQESLSIWGNWQASGGSTANTGTLITGGSSGDGYDQQTTNASLYTYNASTRSFTGFTSANGKNTKYTPLKAGVAYYMFVYGDRTNTVYTSTPNVTTISASGTLLTGDQTYNSGSTIPLANTSGQYTLLGNPYASPVNWASMSRTNLSNTYWGWDPNLNSTGGYVTVSTAGSVTLISPFTGSPGLDQYIQPGQGFFVQTTASSPVLVIHESDKVSNFNANAFRTAANSVPLLAANLYYENAGGLVLADGALTAFDTKFTTAPGKEDAQKILNAAENVCFANAGSLLSIDARAMPSEKDTLNLHMNKLTKSHYVMQVFTQQLDDAKIFLEDKFLKTSYPLLMTDTNRIAFDITGEPGSYDPGRFRFVFNRSDLHQVTAPKKSSIRIYPNPIKDQRLNLALNEVEKGQYSLQLFNSAGQLVLQQMILHDGGSVTMMIAFNKQLPKGIYSLRLVNRNASYTQPVFVQ